MSDSRSALLRFAACRLLRRTPPDCAAATTSMLSALSPPMYPHPLLAAASSPYHLRLGALGSRTAATATAMQTLLTSSSSSPFPATQSPHAAAQQRRFASSAPSRLLALKQRRASIAARVRIPRWAPAERVAVAAPPGERGGLRRRDGGADVEVAASVTGQGQSTEVQLLGEAAAVRTAAEYDALPATVGAGASAGAGLAEADFAGDGTLLEIGAGVDGAAREEGNPRGLPLISAELAAELATVNRHVSMSHLPGGMQRVYERYIEGTAVHNPPSPIPSPSRE